MIAANINPGIYRKGFAFEHWKDFDAEMFDRLYNDDSHERSVNVPIVGADISLKAVSIAERNIKSAGVAKYIKLEIKPLSQWTEAPAQGVLITNPPYGERISVEDMDELYSGIRLACQQYNVDIVGGDTTSSLTGLAISITCIGDADKDKVVYRNGAKETDLICVSGDLGASYMGLQLLEREKVVLKVIKTFNRILPAKSTC